MFTPYDWQEGIGNRAQYIEAKLAQGSPVLAVSLDSGILVFTYRRQSGKVFEIYDRLIFAGIGQQSDVEAVRIAALEFASREAYARSDDDVTIQRVTTAVSQPLKRAFNDFNSAPFVMRGLFGEVGESPDEDMYFMVDYDGEYSVSRGSAALGGTQEITEALRGKLVDFDRSLSPEAAMETLGEIYRSTTATEGTTDSERLKDLQPEAMLLERANARVNRFRLLTPAP